jgi:hypothetical protein
MQRDLAEAYEALGGIDEAEAARREADRLDQNAL